MARHARSPRAGATGPFDGWPLGRGFDRFYGFLDAETDQYAPELVRDNTHIDPPGSYAERLSSHRGSDRSVDPLHRRPYRRPAGSALADLAGVRRLPRAASGARSISSASYDEVFTDGWDVERERRLARQKAMGIVPPETRLPPRNDGVQAMGGAQRRRAAPLHRGCRRPIAGMLDHADRNLARLIAFLETAGSARQHPDPGAVATMAPARRAGRSACVNAMGPYNFKPEPMAEKSRRIDDIGGPDTHSNFPLGLGHGLQHAAQALQAEHPWRRHPRSAGDLAGRSGIAARARSAISSSTPATSPRPFSTSSGSRRRQTINGVVQHAPGGRLLRRQLRRRRSRRRGAPQYFEMFGHRGCGRTAGRRWPITPPARPMTSIRGNCYHLDQDFSETEDLALSHRTGFEALRPSGGPRPSAARCCRWMTASARARGERQPLPRPAPEFRLSRRHGHLPTDVAPDVRSRAFVIEAYVKAEGRRPGRADRPWRRHLRLPCLTLGKAGLVGFKKALGGADHDHDPVYRDVRGRAPDRPGRHAVGGRARAWWRRWPTPGRWASSPP